jgi:hypothetical protein
MDLAFLRGDIPLKPPRLSQGTWTLIADTGRFSGAGSDEAAAQSGWTEDTYAAGSQSVIVFE